MKKDGERSALSNREQLSEDAVRKPPPSKPPKRFAVWTIFGSLLLSLVAAEVLLRRFAPMPDPYEEYKTWRAPKPITSEFPANFSFVTEIEPGLPGMPAVRRRFTTNNMGFRHGSIARPKPANEYRIFMVGGSTTECLYLDDTEAVTFVIQEELNRNSGPKRDYRVYGAGKSGDSSPDHVAMISQRIAHLEPDMIILFCGVNDLGAAIRRLDYCFVAPPRTTTFALRDLVLFTAAEFQLPRYVYWGLKPKSRQEIGERIPRGSDYREKIAARKRAPAAASRPRTDFPSYEENLRTVIGIARAHGVQLVFLTQACTWDSNVDPGMEEWYWINAQMGGVRYPKDWVGEALARYNEVTSRVGKENGIPVFDLARSIEKSREFFYDDCHFNVAGARRAGQQIGAFVLRQLLAS